MNLQIHEEAADWIVKHRDGGLGSGEKESFDAWLRESPHHVRAYLEMSSVWEDVPSLNPSWNLSAGELIARARADDNVVQLSSLSRAGTELFDDRPDEAVRVRSGDREHAAEIRAEPLADVRSASLDGLPRPQRDEFARVNERRRLLYTLAASVLLAFAANWFYLQRGVYATDIGEQRSLALADGSTVQLNSRSRIKVRYSDSERHVDLLEGQALFNVAKNKARPFIVQTDHTRVRAVGTAFDVYKTSFGTVVTVVEGRVAVQQQQRLDGAAASPEQGELDASGTAYVGTADPNIVGSSDENVAGGSPSDELHANPGGAEGVFLAAGEQLVVTPAAVPSPKRANVASTTAWTRRSLVFESSPLTEVAQEFNRYNTRRLVIEDPLLADFHVSGVFSSAEPTLLLRFLRDQPTLVVRESDTEIRIDSK